jgi:hypothetical protein
MLALLHQQRQRIEDEQAKHDKGQLPLAFSVEETRQLRSNQLAWSRRLVAIQTEIKSEPARIQKSFEVRLTRVEPLGVVYLWPKAG